MKIKDVKAREILDSRGNPTVEVDVILEMKLGYNSTITEYIGEFDIVLNNFSYNLYKSFGKK